MRYKNLIAKREHGAPACGRRPPTPSTTCARTGAPCGPLVGWLTEHVGATTVPRTR